MAQELHAFITAFAKLFLSRPLSLLTARRKKREYFEREMVHTQYSRQCGVTIYARTHIIFCLTGILQCSACAMGPIYFSFFHILRSNVVFILISAVLLYTQTHEKIINNFVFSLRVAVLCGAEKSRNGVNIPPDDI